MWKLYIGGGDGGIDDVFWLPFPAGDIPYRHPESLGPKMVVVNSRFVQAEGQQREVYSLEIEHGT